MTLFKALALAGLYLSPHWATAASTWPMLETIQQPNCSWSARDPALRLIHNDVAWQATFATAPLPFTHPVDWQKHTVLALTLGSRPTPGYAIALTSKHFIRHKQTLELGFRERAPAVGAMLPDVISQPCVLILTRRGGWNRAVAQDIQSGITVHDSNATGSDEIKHGKPPHSNQK